MTSDLFPPTIDTLFGEVRAVVGMRDRRTWPALYSYARLLPYNGTSSRKHSSRGGPGTSLSLVRVHFFSDDGQIKTPLLSGRFALFEFVSVSVCIANPFFRINDPLDAAANRCFFVLCVVFDLYFNISHFLRSLISSGVNWAVLYTGG
jgi:hypothetical protein